MVSALWRCPLYRDSTWKLIFSKNLTKNWWLLWFFKLTLSAGWRKDILNKMQTFLFFSFQKRYNKMWLVKLSAIWFYRLLFLFANWRFSNLSRRTWVKFSCSFILLDILIKCKAVGKRINRGSGYGLEIPNQYKFFGPGKDGQRRV